MIGGHCWELHSCTGPHQIRLKINMESPMLTFHVTKLSYLTFPGFGESNKQASQRSQLA